MLSTTTKEKQIDLSNKMEMKGREVAKENPKLAHFALMLAHPEFEKFFDDYFKTWKDCKESIMLLKTGAYLKEKISERIDEPVSGNQLVAAMEHVLNDQSESRFMCHNLVQFIKEKNECDKLEKCALRIRDQNKKK